MRVDRNFAFVDLSGFTAFTEQMGDERAVDVLTRFRNTVRAVGTHHAVRVAKWLGDGCMLVSVEPGKLLDAVLDLFARCSDARLDLALHAGLAGGPVILLEGDDYTGRAVNLASRLAVEAGSGEILATRDLAATAPAGVAQPAVPVAVKGFTEPVAVCRLVPTVGAQVSF